MRKLVLFQVLVLQLCLRSQTITVTDYVSTEPLPGAALFSRTSGQPIITDSKGRADISGFSGSDSILVAYSTYHTKIYSYEQLKHLKKVGLEPEGVSLKEIVVSANRWEEQASENANRIEKIDRRTMLLQNPQTSADLLAANGYVFIQKSQLAGGSPILRGFATNRVMLVVDGVRMNTAIFRSGNVQNVISVDANALQNAEILFGPGAVMYGSDAIGGVMDFHTISPRLRDSSQRQNTRANVMGRYSGANSEKTIHADVQAGGRNFAFLSSFTRSDYQDQKAGRYGPEAFKRPSYAQRNNGIDTMVRNDDPSLQRGSGFNQTNLMQKFILRTGRHSVLDYALHYSETSNAPRYDRLYLDSDRDGTLDYGEWYYGPQKWLMNRLGFQYQRKHVLFDHLRLVAAVQHNQESRHDRRFNSSVRRDQTEKVRAYSLNLDLDKKLGSRTQLFYGAEAVYNVVRSLAVRSNLKDGSSIPINPRYPDNSTWQAYGIYVSLKHRPMQKLILNAALRYSRYLIKADFDTTFFPFPFTSASNNNGALSGGGGLVWQPDMWTRLYCNLSTGFRAPNIDDMGKVFDSQPGTVVVPNPALKPEYAYNAEAGAVKTIGNILKLDGAVYYTYLRNTLARRDARFRGADSILYEGVPSRVTSIQNVASAYVFGVQAGISLAPVKGLTLNSKISYQKGSETNNDSLKWYPKSHVPPLFGQTDVSYTMKKLVLQFYVIYNASMPYDDLSLADRADDAVFAKDAQGLPFVPAWHTLNFKFIYYISQNLVVSGGVENLSDRLYRPFSSGISAPGRNFIISVRLKI